MLAQGDRLWVSLYVLEVRMDPKKKNMITWFACSVVWVALFIYKTVNSAGALSILVCLAVAILSIACSIVCLSDYLKLRKKKDQVTNVVPEPSTDKSEKADGGKENITVPVDNGNYGVTKD